jgi:hypothetical protein
MFADFRHRGHHFGGLIHTTVESAFLTAGAVIVFLGLLLFWVGLIAMRP